MLEVKSNKYVSSSKYVKPGLDYLLVLTLAENQKNMNLLGIETPVAPYKTPNSLCKLTLLSKIVHKIMRFRCYFDKRRKLWLKRGIKNLNTFENKKYTKTDKDRIALK